MAGCGIAITAGLYKLVTFLTKSSTKNEAASQINQVRSIADHLYDLIKRLKKYNDEDNGNTGLDENNNYSTHLNNYSPSKNESSSGKKLVWVILIFGISIAIFLIIRTTKYKEKYHWL